MLSSLEALEPHRAGWDELVVANRRPYSAPAWTLSWWRHAAPEGALLRVVVALDDEGVAGVAPFYAERRRGLWTYRPLAGVNTARIEPLARPGSEGEAARALAAALAGADPAPDVIRFEGVPDDSPWPGLLRSEWPRGRPWLHVERPIKAPAVTLDAPSFDDWMKSKSSNFRQQMRRSRRALEKAGAVFRMATEPDELERDVESFKRLHLSRWEWRGGSHAISDGVDRMLVDAGRELAPEGRFLLQSIDVDGQTIASHLYVTAGGETTFWLGGFDEAYASQRPSLVALVDAVAVSFERGESRFDLGPGDQPYKYRLADAEERLIWGTLVLPGARYALRRALFLPQQARWAISHRLSDEQRERLKKLGRRALRREG